MEPLGVWAFDREAMISVIFGSNPIFKKKKILGPSHVSQLSRMPVNQSVPNSLVGNCLSLAPSTYPSPGPRGAAA